MKARTDQLERDLEGVISKHASWLGGAEWLVACDGLGRAHFHDMPELIDAEAFSAALASCAPPRKG